MLLAMLAAAPAGHAAGWPITLVAESDQIVIKNPLLSALQRVNPGLLPAVKEKLLNRPGGGPAVDDPRAPRDEPTAAEQAQLAQNPDFDALYRRNPAAGLALLRYVNAIITP